MTSGFFCVKLFLRISVVFIISYYFTIVNKTSLNFTTKSRCIYCEPCTNLSNYSKIQRINAY
nr:MAG TPA_asm: hypothetical protein [Caudoviricetes sp.]